MHGATDTMERAPSAEFGDRSGLTYNIIDSDAHMTEPADLWQRISPDLRDIAPKVVTEYKGRTGMILVFEDHAIRLMTSDRQGAARDFERAGGWDPAERLKDMAIDGISGAVLYTTHGFFIFGTMNARLQEELFHVYNDWLAENVSYAPDRLKGLGLVSLFDIEKGTKELERCKKLGLSGVLIWSSPPDSSPAYSAPVYDRFWQAAAELNMPISLHTNTRPATLQRYSRSEDSGGYGPYYTGMVMEQRYLQDSILQLAFGGKFEKFPNLKIVCAEADFSWVAPLMGRADKYFESVTRRGHDLKLSMKPSEYLRRNVWHSFIKDELGMKTYRTGDLIDRIMWSTDYPHPASFFPNSLKILEEDFAGVADADKKKIIHDNVSALYGFNL
jgi:predicted TIM-barrel fold metal-dependent hydrolase